MKKTRTGAWIMAAVMASSLTVGAEFTSYNDPDGFTLGYYEETVDSAAAAQTEELYKARPRDNRQAESLSRGLVAVPGDGGTLVSWRFLGTDSNDLNYNLYCGEDKLNTSPITATNYFHKDADPNAEYTLAEVVNGEENGVKTSCKTWGENYIDFKVTQRDGYNIDDGAVGDLDGDGEYEILLRRVPSMDVTTRTSYPLIEAYKMDGTHMWTIDIGPNEINEVGINMLVYDLDGDGKSELVLRSFEGTTDGAGNKIGDTNNDNITDYSKNEGNLAIFKDRQYIVSTPEFLSVYDGETGTEIDRTDLLPVKEPLSEWSYNYTDTGRLTKRASHFLFGVAHLDGVTPSVIMVRGAWDNVRAAAWHLDGGKFVNDWLLDTPNKADDDSIWGACNHNLITADVDFDGKDEILSGPMAIDHDGTQMYAVKAYDNNGKAQKLGHGDAFDVAKMNPDFNGYLTWACHETGSLMANAELHDARTGQIAWGYSKNKDTGRSRAGDIDPTYKGFEVWASTGVIPANYDGTKLADSWNTFISRNESGEKIGEGTIPMNFKVYWDGDLLSEFLDGTTISKWNWEEKSIDILMNAEECASNSGTKAVPCVSADLFGDWREEIVWKTTDETSIRIYSTSIPTSYKINTLMHDSYYRASVAVQNNHYNQPPNLSFYLGSETTEVPIFEGYVVQDGEKVTNPDLKEDHGTYDIGKGVTGALSVKLLADSPYAYVGTEIVKIDADNDSVVPKIINDRTLVPVRFIAESLGITVGYDDAEKRVTLSGNGYTVNMVLDNTEYTVNDKKYTLDVPAQAIYDRTMIPLRAMAEAIGMKVEWDQDNKLIYIGLREFYHKDDAKVFAEALQSGKKPEATATPEPPKATEAPDPLADAPYTEYTDSSNKTWKIYVDENYDSLKEGDTAGWAGTKKPGIMGTIGVSGGSNKVMKLGGSDKGNRNAIYTLPYAMRDEVLIEFDWNPGECTGGDSYGEIRFADSSNNVFFALKTRKGEEIQYSTGGAIANGALETAEWKNIGTGFNKGVMYHVAINADFNTNTCSAVVSNGASKAEIKDMSFDAAKDFNAIEALAVRQVKNFTWETEIDNLKIGCILK